MKTILLLLVLIMIGTSSTLQAQIVGGQHLKDIRVKHIEIVGQGRFLSSKIDIYIDYGQAGTGNWEKKKLVDKDGKRIVLNSMIDAMNYLSEWGYEFQAAYAVTIGNQNVYHYLMVRKEEQN